MKALVPAARSEPIKSIYLDQFVYSEWAKAGLRGETPASLRLMVDHVSAGRIFCPLSLAHACELARWHNIPARDAAIELMLKLSEGLVMAHIVDVCAGHRPVTWAPFLVPVVSVSQLTVESLDGLSPHEKLRAVFESLAKEVERPADEYIENMLASMNAFSDQQRSPGEASTPEAAWVLDVCRRRAADPGRGARGGDPFDILHTCYAGLTDYGVVDRTHAATVKGSQYVPGQIFSRVDDVLHALQADLKA